MIIKITYVFATIKQLKNTYKIVRLWKKYTSPISLYLKWNWYQSIQKVMKRTQPNFRYSNYIKTFISIKMRLKSSSSVFYLSVDDAFACWQSKTHMNLKLFVKFGKHYLKQKIVTSVHVNIIHICLYCSMA